jgi:hypothetical protein
MVAAILLRESREWADSNVILAPEQGFEPCTLRLTIHPPFQK